MEIKEAIQLLELTVPFSKAALKKAYRDALMVWHPDRFAGNTELKAKAEGRTYLINEAYALLSRIPESDYPYRASAGVQQAKQPPPSKSERASAVPPPRAEPARPQPSSPPQRTAAASPPKQPSFLTITAWVICVPAVVFLIAFITQLQSPKNSANQTPGGIVHEKVQPAPITHPTPILTIEEMRMEAQQGDKEAQYQLGKAYNNGAGVAKDDKEAVYWFRLAAEQGQAEAQFYLGAKYEYGEGVPKDAMEAVKWFRKAADQGEPYAQTSLGDSYSKGEGVIKDEAEAVKWYRKAADQGYSGGLYSLGRCYLSGRGVPKDQVEGEKLYVKAAIAKSAEFDKRNPPSTTPKNSIVSPAPPATFQPLAEVAKLAPLPPSPLADTGSLPAKNAIQTLRPNDQNWLDAFDASEARAIRKYPALTDESSELYAAVSARCGDIVSLKDAGLLLPFAMIDGSLVKLDPDNPDFPYLVAREQSAKLETRNASATTMLPEDKLLRHLASDDRPAGGTIIIDRLKQAGGKGNLKMINGLTEDAYVKMIHSEKLVAAFYVRGGESFTFAHVPDGIYKLIYCTGFGWDAGRRDFARGRHAVRYDELLDFLTTRRTEGNTIITSTAVITLTLHKIANGNTSTSDISLEEFDRY